MHHARFLCPHNLPEFAQIHVHWVGDAIDSLQSQIVTELEENSQSVAFYTGLCLEDVTLASLLMLILQVCCSMTGLIYVCLEGCQWGRVGQAGEVVVNSRTPAGACVSFLKASKLNFFKTTGQTKHLGLNVASWPPVWMPCTVCIRRPYSLARQSSHVAEACCQRKF